MVARIVACVPGFPRPNVMKITCLDLALSHQEERTRYDNQPMEELELNRWLDALAEAGLIGEWQWDLEVETGDPASVQYWIDGRHYTHDGAIRLVREAARVL